MDMVKAIVEFLSQLSYILVLYLAMKTPKQTETMFKDFVGDGFSIHICEEMAKSDPKVRFV